MLTIPTVGARVGGSSVLKMKQPDAGQMIDRFLNPPPKVEAAPAEALTPKRREGPGPERLGTARRGRVRFDQVGQGRVRRGGHQRRVREVEQPDPFRQGRRSQSSPGCRAT